MNIFILANAEDVLINNPDYFSPSNFILDFIRTIGWALVKMLRFLCSGVEELFEICYEMISITENPLITDYVDEFRPLIVAALAISLIVLGITLMFSEKRPPILKNIFLGLMVIFGTTTFVSYLNETIYLAHQELVTTTSITDATISSNIIDLFYMDEEGFAFESASQFNNLDSDAINYLDPAEHATKKSDVSSLGKEVFDTKILINEKGNVKTDNMGTKGWFDIFDPPYYYRYKIHFFQIYLLLLANIFVLVFASYKTFMIITELVITRILGTIFSMEITSGQKTKKIIDNFFNCYFALFFLLVSFKLYSIYQMYINTQNYNGIVRVFLMLFASFAVLDGPNLVEKLFGIDIGFGSGIQKVASALYTSRLLSESVKGAGRNIAGMAGAFSSFGQGPASGIHFNHSSGNPNTNRSGETEQPQIGSSKNDGPRRLDEPGTTGPYTPPPISPSGSGSSGAIPDGHATGGFLPYQDPQHQGQVNDSDSHNMFAQETQEPVTSHSQPLDQNVADTENATRGNFTEGSDFQTQPDVTTGINPSDSTSGITQDSHSGDYLGQPQSSAAMNPMDGSSPYTAQPETIGSTGANISGSHTASSVQAGMVSQERPSQQHTSQPSVSAEALHSNDGSLNGISEPRSISAGQEVRPSPQHTSQPSGVGTIPSHEGNLSGVSEPRASGSSPEPQHTLQPSPALGNIPSHEGSLSGVSEPHVTGTDQGIPPSPQPSPAVGIIPSHEGDLNGVIEPSTSGSSIDPVESGRPPIPSTGHTPGHEETLGEINGPANLNGSLSLGQEIPQETSAPFAVSDASSQQQTGASGVNPSLASDSSSDLHMANPPAASGKGTNIPAGMPSASVDMVDMTPEQSKQSLMDQKWGASDLAPNIIPSSLKTDGNPERNATITNPTAPMTQPNVPVNTPVLKHSHTESNPSSGSSQISPATEKKPDRLSKKRKRKE